MKQGYRYILTFLLAWMALAVSAQDITTLNWDEMRIDTMLPVYSEVVPLESDYRQYDYVVSVEYPEWASLTTAEVTALQPFADQIGEELNITTHVGVSRKVGMLDISFVPIVYREGKYSKLLSAKIVITPRPRQMARRVGTSTPAERYTHTSRLSQGKWVKISVTEDGMYRLTRSDLQRMGFSKPDCVHLYGYGGYRLPEVMNIENYYDDLQEAPFYQVDKDTWVFWANGLVQWNGNTRVVNPYATAGCYFLTQEETSATIPASDTVRVAPQKTYKSFTDHVLYEKDEFAWFHGGRDLYESANYANNNSRTYKLNAANSLGDEQLTIVFTAGAKTSTVLTPTVNGSKLSNMTMSALRDYIYGTSTSKTYDVSSNRAGDDWTVKLTTTSGNDARLDYLALHYTRALKPVSGFVAFSQTGSSVSQFDITGNGLKVMRLPQPGKPGAMETNCKQSGGVLSVVVSDPSRRYVAFDPTYAFPKPTVVGTVSNQNLHALDSLDMVILIPESGKLLDEAERLASAHRQYDGLRVAVVRADQVYNEFSSGTPDATAYRRLMKMLYDRAKSDDVAPKYLLLMGDCAWDNRMLSSGWRNSNPRDYLLCFESENSFSDTQSYVMEDYFGLLDDGEGNTLTRDKADLGVGRFPVTSAAEAKIMVDKTIAYMSNSNAGNWKNIISILGDDGDQNDHMRYADYVADVVNVNNPEMEVRKVMWDAYTRVSTISSNTYPEVNQLIHQQMKDGVMIMNYTGHGATYCLSHEFVLKMEDFQAFKGDHLPLWITAACDVTPFDGLNANLGETAVLNEGGAALAFFGTARTVYAYNNLQLNRQLMKFLLGTDAQGRRYRLGDAIRMAKSAVIMEEASNRENKLHYALLGDPALTIGAPTNRVVLDSINGLVPDGEIQLQAGQHIRMVGHVENANKELLKDFQGVLSARVYDNLETVTCLNNAGAKTVFTFTNREKVLHNGQDSISGGRFAVEFVMPLDINNSNESGRVVFYAINDSLNVEANGYSEDFRIGGTSPSISGDKTGPQIMAYLNTEDFENGGKVNSTPYFIARMTDESGISYSGNGLGHDLLLTIDGDPSTTYVLNDYFVGEFGDYTSGSVGFSIPALEDGAHHLTFRAWDVLNNTSTTTLDFVVDSSLKPTMLQLAASPSIATTFTNFLISYDRPGSECEFTLEVYDFSGRRIWTRHVTGASNSGLYSIPWNLTNNWGGRVTSGVYFYRAVMRNGDSREVSKTQKIILHDNK